MQKRKDLIVRVVVPLTGLFAVSGDLGEIPITIEGEWDTRRAGVYV